MQILHLFIVLHLEKEATCTEICAAHNQDTGCTKRGTKVFCTYLLNMDNTNTAYLQ